MSKKMRSNKAADGFNKDWKPAMQSAEPKVLSAETPDSVPNDERSAFETKPAEATQDSGLSTQDLTDRELAALRRGARAETGIIGCDAANGAILVRLGYACRSHAGDLYITDEGMKLVTGN